MSGTALFSIPLHPVIIIPSRRVHSTFGMIFFSFIISAEQHSTSPPRHHHTGLSASMRRSLFAYLIFRCLSNLFESTTLRRCCSYHIHRPSSYEGPSFCCAERSRARSVAYGAFICPCPFWSIANTQQIPGRVRTGAKRRLETTNSIRHPTILSHRVGRYRFHL